MTKLNLLLAVCVCFTVASALDLRSLFKRTACNNQYGDSYCNSVKNYCEYSDDLKRICAKVCNPACNSAPINKCVDKMGDRCKQLESVCEHPNFASDLKQYCTKTCDPACRSGPTKPTNKCKPDKYYCASWKSMGFCQNAIYSVHVKQNCPNACGFCNSVSKTKVVVKPTTKPTGPAGPVQVTVNIQKCLDAHNDKRALHGAKRLTWDPKLAKDAQKWAMKLAAMRGLEHSQNTGQGENLASGWSSSGSGYTCEEATKSWYDEVKYYDYRNPGFSMKTGHFTQVVWKATRLLGVGIAKNGPNSYYVVARYSPPGNVIGQFKENVLPEH